jgi:hypothetical protein
MTDEINQASEARINTWRGRCEQTEGWLAQMRERAEAAEAKFFRAHKTIDQTQEMLGGLKQGEGYWDMVRRASQAEARVRELEAQYACKRHHGGEGPADDMLRSCQICGLTVDISKGHCEPTIEFTMQGRTDKKAKKVAELEARVKELERALVIANTHVDELAPVIEQNAKLRAALLRLDGMYVSCFDCDDLPPRPEWLKTALADTKGTP